MSDNKSLWTATASVRPHEALNSETSADVCVVGAGIAGISTAYALTQAGLSVVVLDDGPVGGGVTRFTTAHLASAIDDRYLELERVHGEAGARFDKLGRVISSRANRGLAPIEAHVVT